MRGRARVGAGTLQGRLPGPPIQRARRTVRIGLRRRGAGDSQRADIQGLRAVAVLLVALAHGGVGFLKGGFVGVDVFFVLSGFLITRLLMSAAERHRGSSGNSPRRRLGWLGLLGEFYSRRARRILPAAALTLVVTDLLAYHLLNFIRAKQKFSRMHFCESVAGFIPEAFRLQAIGGPVVRRSRAYGTARRE